MVNNLAAHVNIVSRAALAFVFFYHGLVPKILFLNAVEISLNSAHQVGISPTAIALTGGILEIVLGLLIIGLTKTLVPVYIAITMLFVLLIDVAIVMPQLLVEAFNPVTINVVSIVMGYFVIITQKKSTIN